MHELVPGRLASTASRPDKRAAALLQGFAIALHRAASAQAAGTQLVALHHQVVPADLPGPLVAEVLVPPPPFTSWQSVAATSDSQCLSPLGVAPTREGAALSLELIVRGAGNGLEAGEACAATITLAFRSGDQVHESLVRAAFQRPDAPTYEGDDVRAGYSLDRISLAPADPGFGRLIELGVTNDGDSTLQITGIVGSDALEKLGARSYLLPERGLPSGLEGLEPLGSGAKVSVPPGRTARIGVVIDLEGALGNGAWVAGLQPALSIERDGEEFSLRFPLVVSSNGVELP